MVQESLVHHFFSSPFPLQATLLPCIHTVPIQLKFSSQPVQIFWMAPLPESQCPWGLECFCNFLSGSNAKSSVKLFLVIKLLHVPLGKISGKEGEIGQKSKNQNTLLSSLLEPGTVYHLLSENTAEPSMCVYKSHTPNGIAFYFGNLVSCFSST